MLSVIAAVAANGAIGRKGELPWHLPEDLAHFKRVTTGKTIVMGRRTFESIGRALPRRRNIVLSRDPGFAAEGCQVAGGLDAALELARLAGVDADDEVIAIGGAALYAEALPRAERLYLTRVHAVVEGDCFLPELDLGSWREIERRDFPADPRHAHAFSISTLVRVTHTSREIPDSGVD